MMWTYALLTLDVADHAPDETTSSLVEYLLQKQKSDGSWPALAKRPPTEGSSLTNNALALRVLQKYGTIEQTARIEAALSKGRDWLAKNDPIDTEDKVFRLRGLVTAKADQDKIDSARDQLRKDQSDDGGWSQVPDRESDAYATGTVLMALRQADVKPDDVAYAKGMEFLLRTQAADGAWLVESRSRPVQVFFDNGDSGDKSQFATFAATCWATLALLERLPAISVTPAISPGTRDGR
jgi:N-acyl-D-amino-acid deacylase